MDDLNGTEGWAVMTAAARNRSAHSTWLGPAALAGVLVASVLGCKQAPAPVVSEETPSPAAAAAPAKAAFDERAFTLEMGTKGSYVAGQEAQVEVHLKAKSGFKCNDKYPYKFKTKPSPDIAFASEVVRKDAVRLDGKHDAYMTVKFTPKSAGQKTVSGQFSFSVCTDEQCLVERRDLALAIDVK